MPFNFIVIKSIPSKITATVETQKLCDSVELFIFKLTIYVRVFIKEIKIRMKNKVIMHFCESYQHANLKFKFKNKELGVFLFFENLHFSLCDRQRNEKNKKKNGIGNIMA